MNNLNYFNNSEICSHSEFFINHENTLECLQINWSQITLNSLNAFVEDCVLEEFANTGISGFFAGEEDTVLCHNKRRMSRILSQQGIGRWKFE